MGPSGELRLLKFLLLHQLIPAAVGETLEAALAEPKDKGGVRVLAWLAERGLIDEEELAFQLAQRLRIPYLNLATSVLDPEVVALIREDLATRYQVVALSEDGQTLIVAAANPLDRDAVRAVEFATGRRIRVVLATASAIADALARAYHFDATLGAYLQNVPGEMEVPITTIEDDVADLDALRKQTTLPPVVKLLNLILLDGIRVSASDIHIEATPTEMRVRYRVDGMLQEVFQFPKWINDSLVARCKVLAKLDITERQKPQDGRIRVELREGAVDMRVSSLPTQFGEKVTLRILNAAAAPSGLDHLDLSERDQRVVRQAMGRPQGMILVTGPTGSGKTTTLYSMLAELAASTRNIVTIENPIEYRLRGVNQVEVNEKRGLTFAGTLRSILRQDPDVILVGEIRDQETAHIAVQAAQTGHLVLSTLHTNDSVATVTRLLDLGIEPYALGPSLSLIIAQRLMRRVCERCAEVVPADADAQRTLGLLAGTTVRHGVGCRACQNTGYAGRRAVLEVMNITSPLMRLLEARAGDGALRQQAIDDGMVPLGRAAVRCVLDGVTTPDEVLRAVDVAEAEPRCPACERVVDARYAVCPHCTASLKLACASCQKALQPEWQACPYCGTAAPRIVPAAVAGPPGGPPPLDPARRFRVLVVDDDAESRYLLTHLLDRSGLPVDVETVSDGAEALRRAAREPFDLILLDVMMPTMDGFAVCERLRASIRTAFIPILMLTALEGSDSRARGFAVGTDDFVSKPFQRAELLARVRRILHRTYGLRPEAAPLVADPSAAEQPSL